MSCLGTWSPSHSLPFAVRGDISTGSSRGFSGKMPLAVNLWLGNEPLPCCCWAHVTLSLLQPSWSQRRRQRAWSMAKQEGDGGTEGIPQLQPWGTTWMLGAGRRGAESISEPRRAGWHILGMTSTTQRATPHQGSRAPPTPPCVSRLPS